MIATTLAVVLLVSIALSLVAIDRYRERHSHR